MNIAPLLMGALGRMRNRNNLDAGGFQDLLQRSLNQQDNRNLDW